MRRLRLWHHHLVVAVHDATCPGCLCFPELPGPRAAREWARERCRALGCRRPEHVEVRA